MKSNKFPAFILLFLFCLPVMSFGQDIHQQIREMEQARFLQMQEALFSQLTRTDQSGFDVNYYRIELDIDPSAKIISGNVTTQATSTVSGLNQVTLDFFDNMKVDSVISESDTLSFTHSNNELTITLAGAYEPGASFSLTVYYSGQPVAAGGFKSFDFGQHQGVPIISTLSQPFGSPAWWPCKDNPADKADSIDMIVTVPDTLVAASNGSLISETVIENNKKTFFWVERYPISTYLVSLAITNYEIFSDYYKFSDADSMEVVYYVYPEHLIAAQEDFNITVDAISYYSSIFGEYPFIAEKYGMAEFSWGGAMEHQTCTSYGRGLISGNHRYDSYLVHELAHQWFGDLVTMKRWSHIWLNEGFASYSEALWSGHVGGEQAYFDYMNDFDQGLFPTSVFVYDSTNISELFSRTVYDKGAWVLHMLRHVMGDAAFFNALKNYRDAFAFGNATTEDFRAVCEVECGGDLNWFFNQWVYRLYRPNFKYTWYDSTAGDKHVVTFKLDQIQTNTGLFKMPLDIVLTTLSGDTTIVVWDSLATQTFQFVMNEEVINLDVDPNNWVLKELLYDRKFSLVGTISDVAGNVPLEDVTIYVYEIDPPYFLSRFNMPIDTVYSDANGQFCALLYQGFYGILVEKEGYLTPPMAFREVKGPIFGFDFELTSPALSTNIDSIDIFLDEGESYTDTLKIENTGSGELLFSIAATPSSGKLLKTSAKASLQSMLQKIDFSGLDFPEKTETTEMIPPVDSLWQLVIKDPIDNSQGTLDMDETWLQVHNNQLYLKVTTHHSFGSLDNFEYVLCVEADGNPNNGFDAGWFSLDYVILVDGTDKGLLKYQGGDFIMVAMATYEYVSPGRDEYAVGIPLSGLGSVDVINVVGFGYHELNPNTDYDWAPDDWFGYCRFGTKDIPWLNIDNHFGVINASETQSVVVSITPDLLIAGYHSLNLIIGTNQPGYQQKIIPIKLDYITKIEKNKDTLPKVFSLSQNYPNPFNAETLIRYDLPQEGKVTLDIYNLLGQKICRLVDKTQSAGSYTINWDGQDQFGKLMGSGIYFYIIRLDKAKLPARKMIILR